jgi:hypothetical protein
VLLVTSAFTPFYLGRHYAGAYLYLPRPGSWNLHSFTLSAIANLSDRTALVRLDWNMALLTYLRLEAYAQGHLGEASGEFRLGLDVPAQDLGGGQSSPAFSRGASTVDVGVALRLSL